MSRPLILPATASVAMTVIASRAETVRPYERKDGAHVSTYDRNSSPTGASAPTPAQFTQRETRNKIAVRAWGATDKSPVIVYNHVTSLYDDALYNHQ